MFVACAVPIRRIDKLFIDAVDSLFHLNHPDIHYLLFFDQVKLEDPDSILNWKTFEEFLQFQCSLYESSLFGHL